MYQTTYGEYFDSEILTAEPIRLVQILYRGAMDAISTARRALKADDISGRSRQISKAIAILNELAVSLDPSPAPEVARSLMELYDYMVRRLMEANTKQIEPPLIEVGGLLGTLLEGWQQCATAKVEETAYIGPGYGAQISPDYQPMSYAG